MTREEAITYLEDAKSDLPYKFGQAIDMAIEALQAEAVSREEYNELLRNKISFANATIPMFTEAEASDVYKAHEEEHLKIVNRIKELQYAIAKTQTIVGKVVESADAEPTVIRSRTLMPTKDFKEWAKRVRDENPNVIVIPCDAEVVSVEAEWIPCSERLPSDDEYVIVSVIDDHGDTPWSFTTVAWLCNGVWISDNEILFGNTVAWMPMPKPYKGGEEE